MARTRRQAPSPCDEVPGRRGGEGGAHDGQHLGRLDPDDAGTGVRSCAPEKQGAGDVEDGGQEHGASRSGRPGGNEAGDGVRRVMQPVGEGEAEAHGDAERESGVHCLRTAANGPRTRTTLMSGERRTGAEAAYVSGSSRSPASSAARTMAARESARSFVITCARWLSTVLTLTTSR